MSGIVGVLRQQGDAVRQATACLHALQHLGNQSAQVAVRSDDGGLVWHTGEGLVADVFPERKLSALAGMMAIGQVSRATSRHPDRDSQMYVVGGSALGGFAVAFHGRFTNRDSLLAELRDAVLFRSAARPSDAELFAHLLLRAKGDLEARVKTALDRVRGAYTIIVLLPREHTMVALRDEHGVHALYRALLPDPGGIVVASEKSSFPLVEAHSSQLIRPGTAVVMRWHGGQIETREVRFATREKACTACVHRAVFIPLHTATDGDFGSVYRLRYALGAELARTDKIAADIVCAIPMSGLVAGHGYAGAIGMPFHAAIQRNPYGSRYIPEPDGVRGFGTKVELGVAREVVRGQRVVVVDDSLLAGETARHVLALLRLAGAHEVHLRVAAPLLVRTCPYGVPTPPTERLLAVRQPEVLADPVALAQAVGADSVLCLDPFNFRRVIMESRIPGVCDYCYGGGPQPQDM